MRSIKITGSAVFAAAVGVAASRSPSFHRSSISSRYCSSLDNHKQVKQRISSLFGIIPRGGGLFGKDKDSKKDVDGAADTGPKKMYPAMAQTEVEEWLSHIPVFAVTDSNGAGVVLKPDNDTSVFYFFMSPQMANATLTQLTSQNDSLDLRVSAFSLGKIWFRILKSDGDLEVKLKEPGSLDDDSAAVTKGVEYRLVPDTRDLLGARMLLTMDPEEGEKLKASGGQLTPEMASNAIQKAMTGSPKFNSTFNEIPVFMIQQMRMQKQPEADSELSSSSNEEPLTLLPMYFNLQNMVSIWQQFVSQSPDTKDIEPAINLMDLFEIVEKMQEESEIDFRHVVLVPPVPVGAQQPGGAGASASGGESSEGFKMPGEATLGDV